jgi:amidase
VSASRRISFYNDPAKRKDFKPEALWEIEGGLKLSAVDLYAASTQRSAVYQAFRSALQRFDFLAMPTAQVFPFDAKLHWPGEVNGVKMDSYHRWMEIVAGPSLVGCPTVAVPAGFGPGGLPSGIQLIGRSQHDFQVLQLAYAYEQCSQAVLLILPSALQG